MGPDAMIFIFWMLSFNIFTFYHFYSPLSLSSGGSLVLLCFLHKGGVICISEVIDISPSNLDSSLCFIQPALRMIYSAYKLNKQGDSVQPWDTPFPIWNQSVVPGEGNGNPLQYSCLENTMDGGGWWAAVHGVAKSQTQLCDFIFTFHFIHWRRKWQPTPVFLPGESQGQGSLVGCCLWGRTESDMTEVT